MEYVHIEARITLHHDHEYGVTKTLIGPPRRRHSLLAFIYLGNFRFIRSIVQFRKLSGLSLILDRWAKLLSSCSYQLPIWQGRSFSGNSVNPFLFAIFSFLATRAVHLSRPLMGYHQEKTNNLYCKEIMYFRP